MDLQNIRGVAVNRILEQTIFDDLTNGDLAEELKATGSFDHLSEFLKVATFRSNSLELTDSVFDPAVETFAGFSYALLKKSRFAPVNLTLGMREVVDALDKVIPAKDFVTEAQMEALENLPLNAKGARKLIKTIVDIEENFQKQKAKYFRSGKVLDAVGLSSAQQARFIL